MSGRLKVGRGAGKEAPARPFTRVRGGGRRHGSGHPANAGVGPDRGSARWRWGVNSRAACAGPGDGAWAG